MTDKATCDGKLGFRIHAITFLPTLALLLAINLWTGGPFWAAWILLGWSIGLVSHWWFVLGPGASRAVAT